MTRIAERSGLITAGATTALLVGLIAAPSWLGAATTSGSLDATYSGDGLDDLGTQGGPWFAFVDLVAQGDATSIDRSDFRVYLAREGNGTPGVEMVVGRLNADGEPDTGAEWNGEWTHNGEPTELGVDDDDRIYVTGGFSGADVARLLPDGTLDTTYGDAGYATDSFRVGPGGVRIAVDWDGTVTVAGRATTKGSTKWAAWRLNPDGTLDTSFGGKKNLWTADFDMSGAPDGVRLDSEGRILIYGMAAAGETIVRLLSDGSLDTDFGVAPAASSSAKSSTKGGNGGGGGKPGGGGGGDASGGVVTVDLPVDIGMQDLQLGTDDSFYIGGTIHFGTGTANERDPYVMHFDANGLVDTDFGNGTGTLAGVAYPALPGDQGGFDIVIAGGRIVHTGVAVSSADPDDFDVQLYAYDLDGAPDAAFGPNADGLSELGDTGFRDRAFVITLDAAGDVLVAGQTDDLTPNTGSTYGLLARYCW